ncbi:hypothetical protein DFJ63DRAFT_317911 [Scheffersomyces coipomensis]|uniref:uncharacterized protein n=1 Tax=Scheffersomyces coipomensis TaxID=1788519 RepID=UPI00315CE0EC
MGQLVKDQGEFLDGLSPTQEHFLKKYLLEHRLYDELHSLSKPEACEMLGPPFKLKSSSEKLDELPLLSFFYREFGSTFPFIATNSPKDQLSFWQDTVQPFMEKFNQENISNSDERSNSTTKRRQINRKMLSGLLLFYNSTFITNKDLKYQSDTHLKASDTGKLDKFQKSSNEIAISVAGLDDYEDFKYNNDTSINVVAVRDVSATAAPAYSAWNPLSYMSSTEVQRHNFEFILQVTTRTLHGCNYQYGSHFIVRHYHEFKILSNALKKAYPGLMAKRSFEVPLKNKAEAEDYFGGEYEASIVSKSSSIAETKESGSGSGMKGGTLPREKLRLALRGYLRTLIMIPEIIHSKAFQKFISDSSLIFNELTPDDIIDFNRRIEHEKKSFSTQLEFQKQTSKVMIQLTQDFDDFKKKLILDPETISTIFHDIKDSGSIKDQSQVIKTFNEWCKLEVAATLYHTFLSQDNSAEWLNKCRRFHRLFPYNFVYGILRYTNPVKVVGKLLDLLLMNIPSISFGWGNDSDKPKGGSNLLSIIFTMLLDEDLSDFEKELTSLREEKLDSDYDIFLERIEAYCELDNDTTEEIKQESELKSDDLLLTVLSTDLISPKLSTSIDHFKFSQIKSSFQSYQLISIEKSVTKSELFLNLKQYWQIQIRKKDTKVLKQLWKEPELTNLLRETITIFYQPLIQVFAKAQMHVVFKSFQTFMNDLMRELHLLSNKEVYYLNPFQIFNRLKALLDKHEDVLWRFLHNVYINDEQSLFENVIKWTEKYLFMLRIKFVEEDKVKLRFSSKGLDLDRELFMVQLNARTDSVVKKRKLFKQYLEKKSLTPKDTSLQSKLDQEWEVVNGQMFADSQPADFGVSEEDFEEFNHANLEEELTGLGQLESNLKKDLFELEEEARKVGTSELDKLDVGVKQQLLVMLRGIRL